MAISSMSNSVQNFESEFELHALVAEGTAPALVRERGEAEVPRWIESATICIRDVGNAQSE
jgi:hypothetical protein